MNDSKIFFVFGFVHCEIKLVHNIMMLWILQNISIITIEDLEDVISILLFQ